MGIRVVLTQLRKPLAYFSEKLSGPKLNNSTYDKEFYPIVRVLSHWSNYLKPEAFVLNSDHKTLKFLNGQSKLNVRHAKWVEYLQTFTFFTKHRKDTKNVVADALSMRYTLISVLGAKLLGLQSMQGYYPEDAAFKELMKGTLFQGPYNIVRAFPVQGKQNTCSCLPLERTAGQRSTWRITCRLLWLEQDPGHAQGAFLLAKNRGRCS